VRAAPVLAVALAVSHASDLAAQTSARYAERVSRLTASVAALEARAARDDSLAREMALDTIVTGWLRVVTLPGWRESVTVAADSAWQDMQRALTSDAGYLDSATFLAVPFGAAIPRVSNPVPAPVQFPPAASAREITGRLERAVESRLAAALDDSTRRLLGNRVPLDGANPVSLRKSYTRLITHPAVVSTRCYQGDLDACADALGLRYDSAAMLRWYNGRQQREMVQRAGPFVAYSRDARRCVDEGDPDRCAAAMRARWPEGLPAPLLTDTRTSLIGVALAIGGDGAWGRFLTGEGSLAARLERAAGVPLERVVASWRDAVLAARSPAPVVPVSHALATIVWVGLLGAAATRSSRWRL
jgi:hypothetical protein